VFRAPPPCSPNSTTSSCKWIISLTSQITTTRPDTIQDSFGAIARTQLSGWTGSVRLSRIPLADPGRVCGGLRPQHTQFRSRPDLLLRPRSEQLQRPNHPRTRLRFGGRCTAPTVSLSVQLGARDLALGCRSCGGAKRGRIWVGSRLFGWEKAQNVTESRLFQLKR
jgi:hypothetical protein